LNAPFVAQLQARLGIGAVLEMLSVSLDVPACEVQEEPPIAVESAGMIGIHNRGHGENVRAYIRLREDAERPTDEDLIQFAWERVGYKAPEETMILDTMPFNTTVKVDRVASKRMAERPDADLTTHPPRPEAD